MSDLVSKLQHKTYEKGEFSEEKARTLEETIELIKNFPWDQERPLTSVELTGPSVTIQDEGINWFKVGLYFNGKFCLYYLDCNNHLYEYHAPDLDDAISMVTAFFNQQLDLQKFEKHFFNIGNQAHFVTNYFEYHIKLSRALFLMSFMLMYGILLFPLDILILKGRVAPAHSTATILVSIFLICISPFFYMILFRMIYSIVKNRNNYLQLSKGNPIFYFGYDESNISTYKKDDIKEVLVYESHGSRNPNLISVFEICFKDGSAIKFSNILISSIAFHSKFPEDLIKRGKKSLLKMLK
jgi:hypothetical protein